MTFTAYIQRQKSLIRSRREEEHVSAPIKNEIIPVCDTQSLLEDLKSLRGLNTEERMRYSKIFTRV